MAQSNRAASVDGRALTSCEHSSSDCACMTCSGGRESNNPAGSSLNQAYSIGTSDYNRIVNRKAKKMQYYPQPIPEGTRTSNYCEIISAKAEIGSFQNLYNLLYIKEAQPNWSGKIEYTRQKHCSSSSLIV